MLWEWATTSVRRSEDNLCKLILFFNQGSNSDSRVSGRHLYLRASHLPGLAQPFSLLIILLENKIYFNFNEVQFFFFFCGSCLSVFYLFGFDSLHYFMCVLCAVLSAVAHLWRAENKFHQMGPGDQTWVLRLLDGCLYPLSHYQPTSWWESWDEPIIKSKVIKMQPYVFFQKFYEFLLLRPCSALQ